MGPGGFCGHAVVMGLIHTSKFPSSSLNIWRSPVSEDAVYPTTVMLMLLLPALCLGSIARCPWQRESGKVGENALSCLSGAKDERQVRADAAWLSKRSGQRFGRRSSVNAGPDRTPVPSAHGDSLALRDALNGVFLCTPPIRPGLCPAWQFLLEGARQPRPPSSHC